MLEVVRWVSYCWKASTYVATTVLALTNSEPPFVRSEQVGTTMLYFRSSHLELRIVDGLQGIPSMCQVQQVRATCSNHLLDVDRPNLTSSAESFG